MKRRVAIAGLVVAVALGGGWWALGSSDPRGPDAAPLADAGAGGAAPERAAPTQAAAESPAPAPAPAEDGGEATEPDSADSEAPARVEGVLIDSHGRKPIPRVEVLLADDVWEPGFESHTTTTDAAGRFVFEKVRSPRMYLQARAHQRTASEELELTAGETRRVTLVLRPALEDVEVEVVSTSGAGLSSMSYSLVASPVPDEGWTSTPRGDGSFGLCRGRFRFVVHTQDGRSADEERNVDPSLKEPIRLVVRGAPGQFYADELPPVQLKIRVVNDKQEPVHNAYIRCHDKIGYSDADGGAVCPVRATDDQWPVVVTASHQNASGTVRATGKESELLIVLRAARTIRGKVLGALPASDVMAVVRRSDGADEVKVIDGAFTFQEQPPGRASICVYHRPPNQNGSELGCTVIENETEVTVPTGESGTFTFTAVDERGAAVKDLVWYVNRQLKGMDSRGIPMKLGLSPGTHVLVLNTKSSRARYEQVITIRPGQATDLGIVTLR